MQILNKRDLLQFVRERSNLFDAAGYQNPFACSAWVLHFIEQVADVDWTFIVPEHGVGSESLMFLYHGRNTPHRPTALTNYYASLYSPLISSASDCDAAIAGLIHQVVELRPRFATINLAPLDQGLTYMSALRRIFSEQHWYVKQYFCFRNWYLPCAGLSFDQYMEQRPSKLLNTWLRKTKNFVRRSSARLEIITDPADVEIAMKAYQRVHAKSWKKPEPYPDFVGGWAKICAQNGWLRLGLAWVDDVPIAVQFWFTMHRRAYIFKLAYDEEYSKLSAGTLLTAHMIKYSLEQDDVIEIDYLTGDDAYKGSWMTAGRERVGILACNLRSPRGLTIAATEFAGEVRQRWRNSRGPIGNH